MSGKVAKRSSRSSPAKRTGSKSHRSSKSRRRSPEKKSGFWSCCSKKQKKRRSRRAHKSRSKSRKSKSRSGKPRRRSSKSGASPTSSKTKSSKSTRGRSPKTSPQTTNATSKSAKSPEVKTPPIERAVAPILPADPKDTIEHVFSRTAIDADFKAQMALKTQLQMAQTQDQQQSHPPPPAPADPPKPRQASDEEERHALVPAKAPKFKILVKKDAKKKEGEPQMSTARDDFDVDEAPKQRVAVGSDGEFPSQSFTISQFVRDGRLIRRWQYEDSSPLTCLPPSMGDFVRTAQGKIVRCQNDKRRLASQEAVESDVARDLDALTHLVNKAT